MATGFKEQGHLVPPSTETSNMCGLETRVPSAGLVSSRRAVWVGRERLCFASRLICGFVYDDAWHGCTPGLGLAFPGHDVPAEQDRIDREEGAGSTWHDPGTAPYGICSRAPLLQLVAEERGRNVLGRRKAMLVSIRRGNGCMGKDTY